MYRLKRILGETDGRDVAEYGLLAALVSVIAVASATVINTTDFGPVRTVRHGVEAAVEFVKAVLGT